MGTPNAVRHLFKIKLKHGIPIPPGEFHPLDLQRVKDDLYLLRILKHVDNDLKQATEMLWDILVWRKTMGANDITEKTINMNYVNDATFFPHGRDAEGGRLLIVRAKTHNKGKRNIEELKKIVIYWFDRIEREENGKQMSLFFDMDGCGLSNMDMDLIKFLITLKNYYPDLVNYVIIFEMPWILSASFKIVKALLPEKVVSRMKFLTKDTLKEIVAPEQALAAWGGRDHYVFKFVPEKRALAATRTSNYGSTTSLDYTSKKVTFVEQGDNTSTSTYSPGEMLRLDPNDVIAFESDDGEISGQFTITNMDESAISFKIKTTSPEKFLARPSSGVLVSGLSQTISVTVQAGFQSYAITRDRFLVVCVQIPRTDLSQSELAEIWKNSSGSQIDEYRLKCKFPEKEPPKMDNTAQNPIADKLEAIASALYNLQINNDNLHKQSRRLRIYLFLMTILTAGAAFMSYLVFMKANDSGKYCDCDCVNPVPPVPFY